MRHQALGRLVRTRAGVWVVLASALMLRLASPPSGTLFEGDQAYAAAWARGVAESRSLGVSADLLRAARARDEEQVARELAREPESLAFAVLHPMYENPEKVTSLLFIAAMAAWFAVVGFSPEKAELFMVLVSTGTVAAVYGLAWLLTRDRRLAVIAAALMALAPGALRSTRWVSWHLFGQLVFTLTVVAGLVLLTRYARTRRIRSAVAAGAIWGVSLYSNSVMPLLVPVILAPSFFLRAEGRENRMSVDGLSPRGSVLRVHNAWRPAAAFLLGGLVVFLPALLFVGLRWRAFWSRNIEGYAQDYLGSAPLASKLGYMGMTWARGVTPVVLALGLWGLWAIRGQLATRIAVLPLWLLSYTAFIAVFGMHEIQDRAVLLIFPALVVLGAQGLRAAENRVAPDQGVRRWLVGAGVAVAMAVAVSSWVIVRSPGNTTPGQTALEWMLDRARPGTVIVTNLSAGVEVFARRPSDYTTVSAHSLLDHAKDPEEGQWLGQRYPSLRLPVRELWVLLALQPQDRGREGEFLEAVSSTLLAGEWPRPIDRVFGHGVEIYYYQRTEPGHEQAA